MRSDIIMGFRKAPVANNIRAALTNNHNRTNLQIANELGTCYQYVRKQRRILETNGTIQPHMNHSDAVTLKKTNAFIVHTDETLQIFQEYLTRVLGTIPDRALRVIIDPKNIDEENSRHAILDGLCAIKKTISLLEEKFNKKLRMLS